LRKLRTVDSENTPLLPQRNQFLYSAEAYWWKKPFEGGAGTVPLRRRGERSLKPSIFFLAGRCVFLNPKAGAYGFLTHCPSLIQQEG